MQIQDTRILLVGANSMTGIPLREKLMKLGAKVYTHWGTKDLDLGSYDKCAELLRRKLGSDEQIDCAILLLGYNGNVAMNRDQPASIFGNTTIANLNMMTACANYRIKKVCIPLTSCGYPPYDFPLTEDLYCKESCHKSIEAHGDARRAIYKYGLYINRQFGNRFVFPIFNNLFGPDARWNEDDRLKVADNLIKKFCQARVDDDDVVEVWGDRPNDTFRELLYVGDAVDAYVEVLKNYEDYEQPINIGHGIDISIRELAEIIREESGFGGKIVFDGTKPSGVKRKLLDVSKMKRMLNWEPKMSIREGIKLTMEGYLKNNN